MFKRLFKRRDEDVSAATLYTACLKQSRQPAFYGKGRVEDSYDGRIDLLTLHMTLIMTACRKFGAEGEQLNQALYDVMVQDFNIAMREEGIADTGIARRIKPMVSLFLDRTKTYTEALLSGETLKPVFSNTVLKESRDSKFADVLAAYAKQNFKRIDALEFEVVKSGKVTFSTL